MVAEPVTDTGSIGVTGHVTRVTHVIPVAPVRNQYLLLVPRNAVGLWEPVTDTGSVDKPGILGSQ